MSDNKNVDNIPETGQPEAPDINIAVAASEVPSVAGSVKSVKTQQRVSSSSERQIKFERAQKCLENAVLVSKRIKEHRKATAELLGRPFEDDDLDDSVSEMASTVSERTGYSAATDTSTTLSVQEALNIPGISESLANTLKQKELLMERIKQYKEISKKPMYKSPVSRKDSISESKFEIKKSLGTSDVTQLHNTIKEKENALTLIQVKMKSMENTILDLQEKINEKDQIIEAKNKANVIMSESFNKKEKELQAILEDTRQQMSKMQENFVEIEGKWIKEKNKMSEELKEKDDKIKHLEEAKAILDNSRFEISVDQSKLIEELESKNKEILSLKEKIELLEQMSSETSSSDQIEIVEVEKASLEITDTTELMKKIEFLENLNSQIRQTNKELENNLLKNIPETKSTATGSPSKSTKSPLPTRKGGRATKSKSPWSNISSESAAESKEDKKSTKTDLSKLETVIQSLNKDILEKEYEITKKDALIAELQTTNSTFESTLKELQATKEQRKESVVTFDVGSSTDPTAIAPSIEGQNEEMSSEEVKNLQTKLKEAEDQIASLTSEIEAANKNMIKVKSNHKLKLKQMQKTIDNFSKVSDSNAEIIKLNEEMHQLTQKVAELEEEKGNLQLHLVDYDSGRLTESDVYKKLLEMENLAETRLKSISVLEAQKFDLVQELHVLQQKNAEMEDKLEDMSHLHSEQVSSEMKSVQLEEQVDELTASRKELELVVENLKLDKEHLNDTIKLLEEEKEELNHKLQHYAQENIELTDKLEKLSAEKVSSAESIEIVESLTTQEKLELEQYNKGLTESKVDPDRTDEYKGTLTPECNENIEKLVEESAELNKKIELFTQERQEVMEKMGHISTENETLQNTIVELTEKCSWLESNINDLTKQKNDFEALTEDLNRQIEELKRERAETIKSSVDATKPSSIEDVAEAIASDSQHDDKSTGDKAVSRTKSVKQLTKEILKLKNTIKEREAEIGDCQMKILSLEERHQKQNELIQNNASYESKIKALIEENKQLREELGVVKKDTEAEQQLIKLQEANNLLHLELQNIQKEYATAINTRDARINEVENMLLDYEKQIINYSNSLQQKDKEISEYINQITKLNDVSQKLKSTVDLLEEEKSKDQNADLVKSLNKQITVFQRKLTEYEDKLRMFEEEKLQLLNLKNTMEAKNSALDTELQKMQGALSEKQALIQDLQIQQQKHVEEMNSVTEQVKERDEEIHEIKLQLRKESIENEKLRNSLSEKDNTTTNFTKEYDEINAQLEKLVQEKEELNEKFLTAENKNKELMEKLKKFAVNFKKKTTGYAALETEFSEIQKQLQEKNAKLEEMLTQTESLPLMQDKLMNAEDELIRIKTQNQALEQQNAKHIEHLHGELKITQDRLTNAVNEISGLNHSIHALASERDAVLEENVSLKNQVDAYNKKMVEYEIEQKNSTNFVTKIGSLETELNQKQIQIEELTNALNLQEQQISQVRFGYEAKMQERDLYIESLDTEITKYKSRICRLEDTISTMEDRRHSLERKADQLGSQLEEKHKAYTQYTSQEDELVSRLAVLMDHDRVVEKQLHEIESENKELQFKLQHLSDENLRLKTSLSDIQEYCNTLTDKASKTDSAESDAVKYRTQISELENQLKRISQDHQTLLVQRKHDVEELETEFNTQIENAIKEKKILSEKYEKTCEHVNQLDNKLQEYVNTIHTLNLSIEELNKINQELRENSTSKEQFQAADYTEQYVSEINRLNSELNNKNQEIFDLNNKIQSLQINNAAVVYKLESDISELNIKLQNNSMELDQLIYKTQALTQNNEHLQSLLVQKDEEIKQMAENKKMCFEINVPKTEGMVISSTIEPLKGEVKPFDVSSLETQILPDVPVIEPKPKTKSQKLTKDTQGQVAPLHTGTGVVIEPEIVAKKAYLCYKGEEDIPQESDPFNSDEGWGLGEGEETADVTPGLSHLQEQLEQLKKDNDTLKTEIQTSNTKLLKAMKKLKELKSANEMLTNELKISKQISQSSFLDSAIEDELRINIQDLEKKLDEISTELNKEKREKEAIKKQNDVIQNANERLIEMKEKMESEIELWKFKFKEANDKMSTLQWGADSKDSPDHKPFTAATDASQVHLYDEIQKLEKENDELHSVIEQLNKQNKELSLQQTSLNEELTKKLNEQHSTCNNCKTLASQLDEMKTSNLDLSRNIEELKKQLGEVELKFNETSKYAESIKSDYEQLQSSSTNNQKELTTKNNALEEEVLALKTDMSNAVSKSSQLIIELEAANAKLLWYKNEQQAKLKSDEFDNAALNQKCTNLEQQLLALQSSLEEANVKLADVETENGNLLLKIKNNELEINELNEKLITRSTENDQNSEYIHKIQEYEREIKELHDKLQNLNSENDQLLSTVAELRSSVSTAVDQRGFEIAELWKQHLAQRETDFQNMEHELRAQLSASEAKYEQLLDNVQSSSQEETNKLVTMEQVSSLQNKLKDKEEHLSNLQDKYAEVMNQLDMLRSEMEDEKHMHENKLLVQQEEYEKQLQEVISRNQENADGFKPVIQSLETDLAVTKEANDGLKQQLLQLTEKLQHAESTIIEMNNQLQLKDSDIYQKTHDYTIALSQRNEEFENVRKILVDYEKKVEDLTYEKESELAALRLKIHDYNQDFDKLRNESEAEKTQLAQALNEKIVECTNLNKQIVDLNKILEEHSTKASETQEVLENQEYEIVTLKDEIASLQDALRSSSSKIEKHVRFSSDTKPPSEGQAAEEVSSDLLDAVPRAELDLALYMLHQRDVRCEELTMELTQLLEERDTLQLRLSDSLRSCEEIKLKCVAAGLDVSTSSIEAAAEPSVSVEKEQQFVDTHRGQSRSSSISDPDGEKPKLQAKLSELRSVKHSRDVVLRHESEARELGMRLLHRDVANLPPEAVHQLTQAHHTLSRDSQSTSTVLLNWLRGKSTPKVVHM
ncbi:protein lava lamp-like [Leguminivora glycinivorella]|uniref:protein lava lamp-like n=1 Tax=Leguminivora glycinivorella TaxID=1035111 RepID=UPI0020109D42|nr:protein lava lamp-like [Leguminivora glycinivorella]